MQEYRNLVTERNTKTVKPNNKKDKLSETKKREAEIKAALKEVRDNKKVEKKEERAQKAHEFKLDRLDNHPESKRTQKDVRYLTHVSFKSLIKVKF